MTLQVMAPITIRFDGCPIHFEPGAVLTVTDAQAQRLLERAPGKVQAITLPLDLPEQPLQPGWLVSYRDQRGALCGGCDDRQHGTVEACRWGGNGWTLCLTDGQRLPLSIVRAVGQTDEAGQILGAWTVREHGYDGEEPLACGG